MNRWGSWKSVGVLPERPDLPRPPDPHAMGQEERDGTGRVRIRCVCGWAGAFMATNYRAEVSLNGHILREWKRQP